VWYDQLLDDLAGKEDNVYDLLNEDSKIYWAFNAEELLHQAKKTYILLRDVKRLAKLLSIKIYKLDKIEFKANEIEEFSKSAKGVIVVSVKERDVKIGFLGRYAQEYKDLFRGDEEILSLEDVKNFMAFLMKHFAKKRNKLRKPAPQKEVKKAIKLGIMGKD
jgi:hypothetical protein